MSSSRGPGMKKGKAPAINNEYDPDMTESEHGNTPRSTGRYQHRTRRVYSPIPICQELRPKPRHDQGAGSVASLHKTARDVPEDPFVDDYNDIVMMDSRSTHINVPTASSTRGIKRAREGLVSDMPPARRPRTQRVRDHKTGYDVTSLDLLERVSQRCETAKLKCTPRFIATCHQLEMADDLFYGGFHRGLFLVNDGSIVEYNTNATLRPPVNTQDELRKDRRVIATKVKDTSGQEFWCDVFKRNVLKRSAQVAAGRDLTNLFNLRKFFFTRVDTIDSSDRSYARIVGNYMVELAPEAEEANKRHIGMTAKSDRNKAAFRLATEAELASFLPDVTTSEMTLSNMPINTALSSNHTYLSPIPEMSSESRISLLPPQQDTSINNLALDALVVPSVPNTSLNSLPAEHFQESEAGVVETMLPLASKSFSATRITNTGSNHDSPVPSTTAIAFSGIGLLGPSPQIGDTNPAIQHGAGEAMPGIVLPSIEEDNAATDNNIGQPMEIDEDWFEQEFFNHAERETQTPADKNVGYYGQEMEFPLFPELTPPRNDHFDSSPGCEEVVDPQLFPSPSDYDEEGPAPGLFSSHPDFDHEIHGVDPLPTSAEFDENMSGITDLFDDLEQPRNPLATADSVETLVNKESIPSLPNAEHPGSFAAHPAPTGPIFHPDFFPSHNDSELPESSNAAAPPPFEFVFDPVMFEIPNSSEFQLPDSSAPAPASVQLNIDPEWFANFHDFGQPKSRSMSPASFDYPLGPLEQPDVAMDETAFAVGAHNSGLDPMLAPPADNDMLSFPNVLNNPKEVSNRDSPFFEQPGFFDEAYMADMLSPIE